MKHFLFTNMNSDGSYSSDVFRLAYPHGVITQCREESSNQLIEQWLMECEALYENQMLWIVNLAINESTAEEIQYFIERNPNCVVQFIDHRNDTKWLNAYDWAYVNDIDHQKSKNTLLDFLVKTNHYFSMAS